MAASFQQTDTAVTNALAAYCSGLTVNSGTNTSSQAQISGTAGSATNSPSIAKGVRNNIAVGFELPVAAGATWSSGTWTVRLNVTTANSSVTWTEVYICRVNSSGVSQATIGSNTSVGVSLGTTGVKSATVTGTSQTPAAGDEVYIVLAFSNSASHSASSFSYVADQLITSPFAVTSPVTQSVSDQNGASAGNTYLTDSVIVGTGLSLPDNLPTQLDNVAIGYGLSLPDNLNSPGQLDNVAKTVSAPLSQTISDQNGASVGNTYLNDTGIVGRGLSLSDNLPTQLDNAATVYGLSLSDNLPTQLDNAATVYGSGLSLFDSLPTQLDNVVTLYGYGLSTSDTLLQTDGIIVGFGVFLSDLNLQSDVVLTGTGLQLNDQNLQLDSTSLVAGLNINYADLNIQSDSYTSVEGLQFVQSDANNQSDLSILETGILIGDSNLSSDSTLINEGRLISISENLNNFNDLLTNGSGVLLSDNVANWNDAIGNSSGLSLVDSINNNDAFGFGFGYLLSVGDVNTLSDSLTAIATTLLTLSISDSSNNWNDNVNAQTLHGSLTITVADNNLQTDSLSFVGIGLLPTESLNLNDGFVSVSLLLVADNNTQSDALLINDGELLTIDDANSLSDNLIVNKQLSVSDVNTISDSFATSESIALVINDSIVLSDFIGLQVGYQIILTDSNLLTDNISFLNAAWLVVGDVNLLSESISAGEGEFLSIGEDDDNWNDVFISGAVFTTLTIVDANTLSDSAIMDSAATPSPNTLWTVHQLAYDDGSVQWLATNTKISSS